MTAPIRGVQDCNAFGESWEIYAQVNELDA